MKKKCLLLTMLVLFLIPCTGYSLSAVPGEDENLFGMSTPAGSGRHLGTPSTNICKVINLNDAGTGSLNGSIYEGDLRYCLQTVDSPKTIIFETSGTIEISTDSYLRIGGFAGNEAEAKGSYITIAGQTAPSPGITIRGNIAIDRNCHDILIQHLRFRFDDSDLNGLGTDSADGMTLDAHYRTDPDGDGPEIAWTPPYNIVIDHCSFSWAIDENLESGADNITISNCIISEGLNSNAHTKGNHSKGFHLDANNDNVAGNLSVAIIKNIFAHNEDRNPSLESGYAVVSNNIIYDSKFGMNINDKSSEAVKIAIAGNYLISTDIESYCIYLKLGVNANSRAYLGDDNYFDGSIQSDPWNLNEAASCFEQRRSAGETTSDVPVVNRASNPGDAVWPNGYTQMSALDAYNHAIKFAGARPNDRDAVDARIIADVTGASGTSALIDTVGYTNADCAALDTPIGCCTGSDTGTCIQNDEGGFPSYAQNTRALTIPDNPNVVQSIGYTNLEEWLHEFSWIVQGIPHPPGKFRFDPK